MGLSTPQVNVATIPPSYKQLSHLTAPSNYFAAQAQEVAGPREAWSPPTNQGRLSSERVSTAAGAFARLPARATLGSSAAAAPRLRRESPRPPQKKASDTTGKLAA